MARKELDTANSRVERRVAFPWKHRHSEALKVLFLKMRRGWVYLSFCGRLRL